MVHSSNASFPKAAGQLPLPIHMSDAELNDLFAACLPKLKKATRRMLRNPQDSEDALQDGLLLAFRNLQQFQGRSAFATWLYSIVRNSCRMHSRKEYAHPTESLDWDNPDPEAKLPETHCVETRPSPEEFCIQEERSEILRRSIAQLPTRYHRVMLWFHLQGLGEVETARRLRITTSTVKSQLHRSRRMLALRIRKSHALDSCEGSHRE